MLTYRKHKLRFLAYSRLDTAASLTVITVNKLLIFVVKIKSIGLAKSKYGY